MDIKSEKTFEEIVERIVALFRPQQSSDAREFDNSDHQDSNGTTNSAANANATINGDPNVAGGTDVPAPSAASQDNPTARRRTTPPQTEEITF
jgi:hypothetical protein